MLLPGNRVWEQKSGLRPATSQEILGRTQLSDEDAVFRQLSGWTPVDWFEEHYSVTVAAEPDGSRTAFASDFHLPKDCPVGPDGSAPVEHMELNGKEYVRWMSNTQDQP